MFYSAVFYFILFYFLFMLVYNIYIYIHIQINKQVRFMDKIEREKVYSQFYLSRIDDLNLTTTSKFQKVVAYTKGCMIRKQKNLYKSQKYFIEDLQAIMNFDADSSNVVFKQYPQIKYSYSDTDKSYNIVKVQCNRCGLFKPPQKYCPKCQNTHYCSEVCQVNIKLTHQKQECKINCYPRVHHPILLEVHFGTNLGHNIEVYFQHESRAYALVRGKQIIKNIYDTFTSIKKTSNPELQYSDRRSKMEQKLLGYKIQLKNGDKYVEFQKKEDKDFQTGVLKVDLENMDQLKRIYEQNQILEQIELYLLGQGALMTNCAEQIHNNHAHWVYIFRMP